MGEDMIEQVITTISFLFGVIFGENLASRSFGTPRRSWFLLEIILFATLSALLINYTYTAGAILIYPAAFIIGFFVIYASRAISTFLGFAGEKLAKKVEREYGYDEVVLGLARELRRKGLEREEIEKILIRAGLGRGRVKRLLREFFKEVPER
ncbi:hypothetical protein DRN62_03660 [Nanoarchaeota archaeon]|nr:MAG: hypothetical protein DRN62_03660 [Nanoarchaeota archaeon]